jgi:hypothetical protein
MHKVVVVWLCRRPLHVPLVISLFVGSCTSLPTSLFRSQPVFPPQTIIENGNYEGFLSENQRNLSRCGGWPECDVTLYNLGFVFAYPASPYRDPQKARRYLDELRSRYPQSPWTSQGQVLLTFMNEQVRLEEAQRRLRATLHNRDVAIRKLQGQLNRSREIDLEIDKKARELLR